MRRTALGLVVGLIVAGLPASAQAAAVRLYADAPGPGQPLALIKGGDLDGLVQARSGGGQAFTISGGQITTSVGGAQMCLDLVPGGTLKGYARVIRCTGKPSQQWSLKPEGSGFRLTNGGRCLEVVAGGDPPGLARLAACKPVPRQVWGKK